MRALFISERVVEELVSTERYLEIIEATLAAMARGRVAAGDKSTLTLDDGDGLRTLLAMPGVLLDQRLAGVKWVGTFNGNAARALPRAPAAVVLSDAVTGALLGVVEATALTARRTAALASVAAKYCARRGELRAAIIGFGAVGQALVACLSAVPALRLHEIRVFARNAERLTASVAQAERQTSVPLVAAGSVEDAVRGADIVVTATGIVDDEPVVTASMVREGAFVCGLGSYQEIELALIERAAWRIVDSWDGAAGRGNFARLVEGGSMRRESIAGTLAEVVVGKVPGRRFDDDVVVASLMGLAPLDLAICAFVLEQARERGFGCALS